MKSPNKPERSPPLSREMTYYALIRDSLRRDAARYTPAEGLSEIVLRKAYGE